MVATVKLNCFAVLLSGAISAMAANGAAVQSAAFDRLYVFGDSYSDLGEGYLDGNGPTAVGYLAERLGITLLPSNRSNGIDSSLDFAVSGAGTGSGDGRKVEGALLGLGMQNQVEDFAARVQAGSLVFRGESTLFFLAGGLNDSRLPSRTTLDNLKGEIRRLYALGARTFLLANLPVETPAFRAVGLRLNPDLPKIPAQLTSELSGASISLSHWGSFFDEVMLHPAAYGIRNTTAACAGRAIFHQDPTPCPAPETFFYYHAGHPSKAVHKAVGEKLFGEVLALRARTKLP